MRRLLLAITGFLLAAMMLTALQWMVPQRAARPRLALDGSIDFNRLFDDVARDWIGQTHQAIVAPASRLAGTAGDRAAADLVEREFRRLNLEVITQSYPVTVPVTKWCRIGVAPDGSPDGAAGASTDSFGGVSLAPFWPNHVRTCTTGPQGITGRLIDGGAGRLGDLDGKTVAGNILLLRMTRNYDWLPAAKLGAAAILFRPSDDAIDYAHKSLHFPASLPRFLVTGPVDELVGMRVRIDARVDWEVRTARNVFGVLRAPNASREALVQIAFTDSWSAVPDQAPGYYEACSVTSLLAAARALAGQRRGLGRHAVFVACSGRGLGAIGPRRIIDALGVRDRFAENHALLEQRLAAARREHVAIQRAREAVGDGGYWSLGADAKAALWQRQGPEARAAFAGVVQRLVDRHIQALAAREAAARLAWQDGGRPDHGPLRDRQLKAAGLLRRAQSASGADPRSLERDFADVVARSGCRERLAAALDTALAHARGELACQQGASRVADLLGPLERSCFLILAPSTHGVRLRYECLAPMARELEAGRDAIVLAWLAHRGRRARVDDVDRHLVHAGGTSDLWSYTGPNRVFPVEKVQKNILVQITRVITYALHVPLLLAAVDLPDGYQTPLDTRVSYEDLTAQTQLMTAVAAHLLARAEPLPLPVGPGWSDRRWFSDIGGEVVTTGGANTILPSRRVADALVVLRGMLGRYFHIQKARDGVFRFPAIEVGPGRLLADAFTIHPESGAVTGARDMGLEGQRFKTSYYKAAQFKETQTRITLLLARMAPTDFYHLIGPASQPVTLEVLDAALRTPLDQYAITHDWDNGATVFVRPGHRFYLALRNYPHYRYFGREVDRERTFTKGFLTGWGTEPAVAPWPPRPPPMVDARTSAQVPDDAVRSRSHLPRFTPHAGADAPDAGPGYLAGRDRRGVFHDADAALSAASINRRRLGRQMARGLADPVNVQMADRAERLLARGMAALQQKDYTQAYRHLNESMALSMRAYPIIRMALIDAVSGILLYLFLCIPFALFAERLLLGSSDIRGRIAGTFVLFLLAFLLIRATHPAYEMISSPLMVLVGFLIAMLCLLIMALLLGRFAERMADLRRLGPGGRGSSGAAESDISRAAAAAAAFTLGLNNMRKRKVRTALTVATLVLVSFCLVCFTAPSARWLERRIVVGPASYDGALLRFERVAAGHLGAARDRYGDRGVVIGRRSVYQAGWGCVYFPANGRCRRSYANATLLVQPEEARLTGMDRVLRAGRWFGPGDGEVCYVSDVIAAELGIDPVDLGRRDGSPVEILLAGWPVAVAGIFDSGALDALRDIDGETILPEHDGRFTGTARIEQRTRQVVGRPGVGRISASHVAAGRTILMPLDPERNGLASTITLLFEGQSHGAMLETIDRMMDSAPTFIGYALDGLCFFGGRFRFIGVETLVDVVVPLLIASFIVLNTMLGSVHERRGEIAVYAAIGLSPRHVFFLFLAESLVYAVIGVVGGYLLALVLQAAGHVAGDAWGITVNTSSRSAIWVTLAIMAAVLLSTIVPARRAARIASPSLHSTWSMPVLSGPGRMDFQLPFTFLGRDALAVVPFLGDWFDAHGADASGAFSSSTARVQVDWAARDAAHPMFHVAATTWQRPYDLGVSQSVRVSMVPVGSRQAGHVFVTRVELRMLTGDANTWRRSNRRFIGLLRHHLLRWRSLSPRRKQMLYERFVSSGLGVEPL